MIDIAKRLLIEDLYAAYVSHLDAARYAEWLDLFVEDCTYRLVPRENFDAHLPLATMAFESKAMLEDRVYGVTQTLVHAPHYQRHLVSCLRVVAVDADSAQIEANYLVLRTKRNDLPEILNTGRYLDRLAYTQGRWRFAEKLCVFDSELIPNSIIYPI
jgi:salicylate 5-hydroxylase small subunit